MPDPLRAAREQLRASILYGADFTPLRHVEVELSAATISTPVVASAPPAPAPRVPPPTSPRPVPTPTPRTPDPTPEPALIEPKPRSFTPTNLNSKQSDKQKLLDALRAKYEKDAPHQNFVTDHHCIVFGDGNPAARLMIIGEAPGAEEDKVGIPFVGRAGQLLEKMLGGMGLSRSDVYITNVLKTRPPNNATPTADEAAACAPYLYEQIKIISPECILALGLPATRVLLNSTDSMSRLRGRWTDYADPRNIGFTIPVMPTYHPAFLLRSYTRENREKVWSDLQMIMQKLGLKPPANAAKEA